MSLALADILAKQSAEAQREFLSKLPPEELAALAFKWDFWARPEQLEPPGEWSTWMVLAGRGYGKTRLAAEWVRQQVCGPTPLSAGRCSRIAIVAETAKDLRETVAKGPSGILATHPKEFRPSYTEKSGFTWPNGATALLYNGTEPGQLRGPNFDGAWCDEIFKWRYAKEAWDMLSFALRLSQNPRVLITSTPRPLALLREIMADPDTVVTRGSLYDNRANLSSKFVHSVINRYQGTRLGRQEIDGEIVDDVPGALWTRDTFDRHRKGPKFDPPPMTRLVVAIDPAAKKSADDDETAETGIVVAGIGEDGRGYLIDDRSCRLGPMGWAKVAVAAYDRYDADCIVVETNNGGDMVEQVIKAVRPTIKVVQVWASRGKTARAEPVSALYEQGRISHLGNFPMLEDEAVQFTSWGIEGDLPSDRVDAMVWAFTHLFPSLISRSDKKKTRRSGEAHGRSETTGY